ncbi:related to 26S proteasome non-ATPase regulatory subunit 9 [Sporisorium scitamineum]|uniref:Probable 26S proteasome regulatory subunit p27 n=1 Tax=Sporisorium scitamineum TaxID=49012 RepID=A0A0F7RUJ7_9BASI|nr:hypothetical protein [Sporisorium scitamineum]CDU25970.1 related to 26S proteasome non-ATPase regulatory subunit 9 [Sporisorium scitamineum]
MSTDLNADIHTTSSVADTDISSALAQPLATSPSAARTQAMSLLELQKQLDADLSRHMAVLTSNGVNMQTPLVDAQGFPLADKDLMAIRTAKQRINVLRNDSKALRDRVAQLLELAINGDASAQLSSTNAEAGTSVKLRSFARVNSVAEGSPAQAAGLVQGDQVVKFGSVTSDSPKGLAALAAPGIVVDGESIQLVVTRQGAAVNLTLTPRAGWGGRGLLGCHLLPL